MKYFECELKITDNNGKLWKLSVNVENEVDAFILAYHELKSAGVTLVKFEIESSVEKVIT